VQDTPILGFHAATFLVLLPPLSLPISPHAKPLSMYFKARTAGQLPAVRRAAAAARLPWLLCACCKHALLPLHTPTGCLLSAATLRLASALYVSLLTVQVGSHVLAAAGRQRRAFRAADAATANTACCLPCAVHGRRWLWLRPGTAARGCLSLPPPAFHCTGASGIAAPGWRTFSPILQPSVACLHAAKRYDTFSGCACATLPCLASRRRVTSLPTMRAISTSFMRCHPTAVLLFACAPCRTFWWAELWLLRTRAWYLLLHGGTVCSCMALPVAAWAFLLC